MTCLGKYSHGVGKAFGRELEDSHGKQGAHPPSAKPPQKIAGLCDLPFCGKHKPWIYPLQDAIVESEGLLQYGNIPLHHPGGDEKSASWPRG